MKQLILIRHAERKVSSSEPDQGLTPRGRVQAEAIARLFLSRFPEKPVRLQSSPRRRCRETLEVIARLTGGWVEVDALLLEQESDESQGDFMRRIEVFLGEWKASEHGITMASTHGDWLPLAIEELTGQNVEMQKGAWAQISWDGAKTRLEQLIQKP